MKRAAIGLALLPLAGFALWFALYERDEAQIRRSLGDVEAAVNDRSASPPLHAERLRRSLLRALSADVHADAPDLPIELPSRREDLAEAVVEWTAIDPTLSVAVRDPAIAFDDAKTSARVTTLVSLHSAGAPPALETRAAEIVFRKEESGWKVSSVTLRPPDSSDRRDTSYRASPPSSGSRG
jgi:hypothetical protein